jgi:hypothetical protein
MMGQPPHFITKTPWNSFSTGSPLTFKKGACNLGRPAVLYISALEAQELELLEQVLCRKHNAARWKARCRSATDSNFGMSFELRLYSALILLNHG